MSQGSDLSAYEKLRMENIRKNNEFLAQLGLFPMQKKEITQPNIVQEIREKKKRVKVETDSSIPLEKRRRSGRLSGQFVKDEEIVESQGNIYEEQVGEQEPFYDRIPQESDQLDDYEFQAFVELRKWRLLRSRELAIETYKIFQNRTFCDMIRRRRNNPTWATCAGSIDVPTEVKQEEVVVKTEPIVKIESNAATEENSASDTPKRRTTPRRAASIKKEPSTVKSEPKSSPVPENKEPEAAPAYIPELIDDLTDCFGIAGGKTKEGGYAWEALAVLNRRKITDLLEQSRTLKPKLEDVSI